MSDREKVRVLCVDDEPAVLEAMEPLLRRRFRMYKATSGQAGLEVLEQQGSIAVVLSDMRMPGMNGAQFLSEVRKSYPDAVRMLLTGYAEIDSAIAAVNEGQVFRFLTKPCPPRALLAALEAAAEQNRLVTAEKVLLEQTLHGAVKTLADVLSLANPAAFGRATRVKLRVSKLADRLGLEERWPVEVAALLAQIGCVTLPSETVEKLYYGDELSADEEKMVASIYEVSESLLSNIPRLEPVREILLNQAKQYNGVGGPDNGLKQKAIPLGARILRIVLDFDAMQVRGLHPDFILAEMRKRVGKYDDELLEVFASTVDNRAQRNEIRELPLHSLRVGMILVDDIVSVRGPLLVAHGNEVTDGLLARLKNLPIGYAKEPVRVIVRPGKMGGSKASA